MTKIETWFDMDMEMNLPVHFAAKKAHWVAFPILVKQWLNDLYLAVQSARIGMIRWRHQRVTKMADAPISLVEVDEKDGE